jgi:hypothetical protein
MKKKHGLSSDLCDPKRVGMVLRKKYCIDEFAGI